MTAQGMEAGGAEGERAVAWVRRLYEADRVAAAWGVELASAGVGRAAVRMTVRPDMLNGAGTCHGGVIFTLADIAFQCACNSCGRLTVSAAASADYVRPARVGDRLLAVCTERYRTRSGGGYDVEVTRDDDDRLVAVFWGKARELGPQHRPPSDSD